jgi:hypothetical protein
MSAKAVTVESSAFPLTGHRRSGSGRHRSCRDCLSLRDDQAIAAVRRPACVFVAYKTIIRSYLAQCILNKYNRRGSGQAQSPTSHAGAMHVELIPRVWCRRMDSAGGRIWGRRFEALPMGCPEGSPPTMRRRQSDLSSRSPFPLPYRQAMRPHRAPHGQSGCPGNDRSGGDRSRVMSRLSIFATSWRQRITAFQNRLGLPMT